jgi:hypothetical protein
MKHAMIPDTQIFPGSETGHIRAAAKYLRKHRPDKIILIGDWWDFPSLSSYDKAGDRGWESKNLIADLASGWDAMKVFLKGVRTNRYDPEIHFCVGNHEYRVTRAASSANLRRMDTHLSLSELILKPLEQLDVTTHQFLEIADLDGICYSHYFVNPTSLMSNAIGGTIESKLKSLGRSFSMGHQQTKQTGEIYTCTGKRRRGLVCGRFYSDYHEYLGPQKNAQSWSGILLKHEVDEGDYDLMEVSMEYLMKEYTP